MPSPKEVRIYRVIERGQYNSRCLFSDGTTGLVPNSNAMVGRYHTKRSQGRPPGAKNKKGTKKDREENNAEKE